MSLSNAHAALLSRVATALSGITYGHENAALVKPSNAKWGQVFFMPNQPSVNTLGSTGQDMVDGIMQIDMNYPMNTGGAAADSDYETVRTQFAAGTKLTSSSQSVIVRSCGRSTGRLVDQWYRVSFTVEWYAFLTR